MSSSVVNNCRYGDIFPFVRSNWIEKFKGILLLYGVL